MIHLLFAIICFITRFFDIKIAVDVLFLHECTKQINYNVY